MFSQTGISKEVLIDQGMPFILKIKADLFKLFQIMQLETSVYNPLIERFNKILESMLKRVDQREVKNYGCLPTVQMFRTLREMRNSWAISS